MIRTRMRPAEMNVFDHLRVIYRHRRLTATLCVLAGMTTGIVCLLLPPRYVATASVVPPLEMLQGAPGLALGLLGGGEAALLRKVMDGTGAADMYVGLLESRVVADALVDRFDLTSVYRTGGSRRKAKSKLRNNTTITATEEGIIYITVEDRDRDRAAALANAYVEELDGQNKRLSTGQATSKRVFLENRLREVEQKLSRIETLPSGEAQVQEMVYELLIRELEIAKIEEAKSMPTIQVLDAAVPPEGRKARGTIRKAGLAAVAALVCALFLAFGREYYAEYRRLELQAVSSRRQAGETGEEIVEKDHYHRASSSPEEQRSPREPRHGAVEAARRP